MGGAVTPRRTPRREVQSHLVPLGAELRRVREAASLSQTAVAEAIGAKQDAVSLIEAGRQPPAENQVRAWATATGADTTALLELRERALTRQLDIRAAARRPGGADALQGDLELLESTSAVIAEYQPTMIPGLVQTPAYTRAWLLRPNRIEIGDPPDVEDVVRRRAARQRQAADRQVVVAVQPAALVAMYGTAAVQAEQLEVLVEQSSSARLELIVANEAVALMHGFELIDDAVIVETVVGAHVMAAPEVIEKFAAALERIRRTGLTGERAVAEVHRAREKLTENE